MSVVFINHPLETGMPTPSGAPATIIRHCCREAEKRGGAPWIIAHTSEAALFPWMQTICLESTALPQNPVALKALGAQRALAGWRRLRHGAYAAAVLHALRKFNLTHLPLVLMNDPEMAVYLHRRLPETRIIHWFQSPLEASPRFRRAYARSVNVTLGASSFTGRWAAEYYGVANVRTVYNGVDVYDFHPAKMDAGLPAVTVIGRAGIEKAPDLLLKAAIELSASTTNFRVLLIGSNYWDRFEVDNDLRELMKLMEILMNRGVRVSCTGHVGRSMLPGVLRNAHIYVDPARSDEPFDLTTLEAMATGLPVVGSDIGGMPETIGNVGLLFARDSVSELARQLGRLIADVRLREDLGWKSRVRALEFPWERTWQGIERAAYPGSLRLATPPETGVAPEERERDSSFITPL